MPVNVSFGRCKSRRDQYFVVYLFLFHFLYIYTRYSLRRETVVFILTLLSKNYIDRCQFNLILLKIFCVDKTQNTTEARLVVSEMCRIREGART